MVRRRPRGQRTETRGQTDQETQPLKIWDCAMADDIHTQAPQGRATFTMQFDHYAPVALPDGDPPFRPATAMRA
jgi:hypothetical protein